MVRMKANTVHCRKHGKGYMCKPFTFPLKPRDDPEEFYIEEIFATDVDRAQNAAISEGSLTPTFHQFEGYFDVEISGKRMSIRGVEESKYRPKRRRR